VSKREVRVSTGEEIAIAYRKAASEPAQQLAEFRRPATAIGLQNALELDEFSEPVDPIEVDPDPFDDEELPHFRHYDENAEGARERLP